MCERARVYSECNKGLREPREGKRVAGVLFLGSRGLVIHVMEMNDLIFPSTFFLCAFPLLLCFFFFLEYVCFLCIRLNRVTVIAGVPAVDITVHRHRC